MADPTILHLTDLHLGDANPAQVVGDYKARFVSREARATRERLFGETLAELGRRLDRNELTAVVVSGDITYVADESGFERLDGLLAELGDQLPPPERIVVVPGNHDVKWKTDPGSDERYALFRQYVSDRGYRVPALSQDEVVTEDEVLVDRDSGVLIAPLNSSNWCGTLEPVSKALEEALEGGRIPDDAKAEIERLRLLDPGRIVDSHLAQLRDVVRNLDRERELIRIAVLHHQLLPLSTDEELKPYEGITNLQLLRLFLEGNGFSLVLHGHKHSERAYYDRIADSRDRYPGRAEPVLVVGGSTLGGVDAARAFTCRLIRLQGAPTAPVAAIERIQATDAGSPQTRGGVSQYPLWNSPSPEVARASSPTAIYGDDLDEVYDRLIQVAGEGDADNSFLNLSCHLRSPGQPQLPGNYPRGFLGGRDADEWFTETVDWWQRVGQERDHGHLVFSHGDRIRRYRGAGGQWEGVDQLAAVESLLRGGMLDFNGRAVVSLLDPCTDHPDTMSSRYPAFAIAQFILRQDGADKVIDIVGIFRKQELRYWWPVNVAELAQLQAEIVRRLGGPHRAGTISTFSTIAYVEEKPPPVVIPRVDVLFEREPEVDDLFRLAFSLLGTAPCDDSVREEWDRVLEDLFPPKQKPPMAGQPVALNGLKALSEDVDRLVSVSQEPDREVLTQIVSHLDSIHSANEAYVEAHLKQGHGWDEFEAWRKEVEPEAKALKRLVDTRLEGGDG